MPTNTITINGTGVGGNGALTNSSDYVAGNSGLNVVLGSASSIGGPGPAISPSAQSPAVTA